jgi:hypothetical protein
MQRESLNSNWRPELGASADEPAARPSGKLRAALARQEEVLRRTLILAIIFSIPALLATNALALIDPDVWWHLRTGQWIIEHRALPPTDPFSAYGMGKPWVVYSWLFEVLLAGLYQLFGLRGIIFYSLVLLLLIGLALYSLVRRFEPRFVHSAALTAVGLFAICTYITPRPWFFTILFFILELELILTARRTGNHRRLLWLPPLFMLWANLHIQFVYGLFVLGLAFAEPLFDRLSGRAGRGDALALPQTGLTLLGCLLATLCTPHHFALYHTVYELVAQTGPLSYIVELQAMGFRFLSDWLTLFVTMGAAFALAWHRRLRPFTVLLLLAGAYVSFRSTRDAWFVVVSSIAIIASARPPESGARVYRLAKRQVFAVAAVSYIAQAGLQGPLYNDFGWGGFLIWRLPQHPVALDGRTNIHGDARIERSMATWSGKRGWQADPDLAAARLVIGGVDAPLTSLLRLDPRFKLVYEDQLAAVFVAQPAVEK